MRVPSKAPRLRLASHKDLEALCRLEHVGFATDRFAPRQFHYLLTKARATTLVLDWEGGVRGAAIVLWRSGAMLGRLYSIVVDPAYRGRGFAGLLLEACERACRARGCDRLGLEVRVDNQDAIAFYRRHGFEVVKRLDGYYERGAPGLKLVKHLGATGSPQPAEVPYYAQTLEFTCGPACLMMAMKRFDSTVSTDRATELMLWKEATLIFMTSGLGGCGPFGLALAARRRGFAARIILSSHRTPFLHSVRSPHKREVVRLVHGQLKAQALAAGVQVDYRNFAFQDIVRALGNNEVPIVLISTYRLHKVRMPHWVVITGMDRDNVYFHDPYEGFYIKNTQQAQHVRIPISEFRRIRRYGKQLTKSVIFIGKPR